MPNEKVSFSNESGQLLAARLELPDSEPRGFAVFAHCFTCSKDLTAVRSISRSLTNAGIAVLGFDFTGLGKSEGNFADTNFSSNVEDLVCAANFLAENYQAPKILIGHSLGGAAVIFAADKIRSVQAVATIGAPSDPKHVAHLFASGIEEIEEKGEARLSIGGREFNIQKQFLDDLNDKNMASTLKKMKTPLLVMHSPQDRTVGIENAANIYRDAWHPKSFITLDGADHLLTEKKDSLYAGTMIAAWSERYI